MREKFKVIVTRYFMDNCERCEKMANEIAKISGEYVGKDICFKQVNMSDSDYTGDIKVPTVIISVENEDVFRKSMPLPAEVYKKIINRHIE